MRDNFTYFVLKSREGKPFFSLKVQELYWHKFGTSGSCHSEAWNVDHKGRSRVERQKADLPTSYELLILVILVSSSCHPIIFLFASAILNWVSAIHNQKVAAKDKCFKNV